MSGNLVMDFLILWYMQTNEMIKPIVKPQAMRTGIKPTGAAAMNEKRKEKRLLVCRFLSTRTQSEHVCQNLT